MKLLLELGCVTMWLDAPVQMYQEMASRHRVRASSISIIKTATVPAKLCKRDNVKQFHDSKISFPITHKLVRCVLCPAGRCAWTL